MEKKYRVLFKPYKEYVGIVENKYKRCTTKKYQHIILEYIPTKDQLKVILWGMTDRQNQSMFSNNRISFPHRIHDKELENFEIVEFNSEKDD